MVCLRSNLVVGSLRDSLDVTSPVNGAIVPFMAAAAVSLRACSRRPMMKTLEALLASRARAIVRPRPGEKSALGHIFKSFSDFLSLE